MYETILNPNPFSNPIASKNRDKKQADIFSAVGYALYQWEYLETQLTQLYMFFCFPEGTSSRSYQTTKFSFGSIHTPNTRRTMIERAAEVYFKETPTSKFKPTVARILRLYKDASSRRNDIAHGLILNITSLHLGDKMSLEIEFEHGFNVEDDDNRKQEYVLAPSVHATGKRDLSGKPKYSMSSSDIKEMASNFMILSKATSDAFVRLIGEYQSIQEEDVETLLRKQIHQRHNDFGKD
jgi:hypothetical protein